MTMLLTPDQKLIHSILQGGIKAYYEARTLGVRAEVLFEEAKSIWELMETMSSKGRLPSLPEIQLVTGQLITQICPDPIDIEIVSSALVKRGLTSQLHDKLGDLTKDDAINADPFKVRDNLSDVIAETAWSFGEPYSTNSRASLEELVEAYDKAESRRGGLIGLSSPWPTMDEASLGLQEGELTVLFAKRKVGKTIQGDTLLHDPVTGQERTIKELVEAGVGRVLTWEKNKPLRRVSPAYFLDCGTKECVKITWRSGRSMIAAKTHPFLTPRGWKRADELQEGHHTGASVFVPEPLKPETLVSDEHVKILALMIAEGGTTQAPPTFTSGVPALVDELRQSMIQLEWSCELRKRSAPKHYEIASDYDNEMVAFLEAHGLMGKRSVEKTIPPIVYSLNDHQLGVFLGSLWSCDGSVENSGIVSYSTGSHRLALQVQHLLLRFGVTSRVRTIKRTIKSTGEEHDYYEIYVHRQTIERFKAHVKLIGPKAKRIQEVFFQGKDRLGWLRNEELWDEIHAELQARPELVKVLGDRLGYTTFRFQKSHLLDYKSGRIRHKVFKAFCEVYGSNLKWVLDENIWWDEIESIETVGKHHCYDLSIPETECYIANDFIVHNSWLAIAWAVHIWRNDIKPGENLLFVTMEMTPLQVLRRMACVDLHLSWDDFRGGRLTSAEKKALHQWVACRMAAGPDEPNLIIVGSNQVRTIKDLAAVVGEHRPKGVVVDSFYILGRSAGSSIYERVLANVQGLKLDIALRYGVPVLASTQLKGTTSKDVLTADSDDAMGAKAIGDYADVTRGLFCDTELKAASQRLWRGMEAREFLAKDVKINFDFTTMDFSEIEEIDPDDPGGGSSDGGDDSDDDPKAKGSRPRTKSKAAPFRPIPATDASGSDIYV